MAVRADSHRSEARQIGERIKSELEQRRREAEPVDLTTLAATVGVSVSTFHRILNGETDVSYIVVVRLARALGKPLDWFVGEVA
jgi:transcriptional regulator with XRE-family HTH domain